MAVNFQQVYEKIQVIRQTATARQEHLQALRQRALTLLQRHAEQSEALRAKIEHAKTFDPNLRCALPLGERLDAWHPAPKTADAAILIAADGSQIAPDRHAPAFYSLLNIGGILLESGSGKTPQVFIDSNLLYEEELYREDNFLSAELLAQERDLAERRKLLELAQSIQSEQGSDRPIVALTDGPIELWGAKESNGREYHRALEAHQTILVQLKERGAIVAGYVDKPSADLLTRLLEIAALDEEALKEIRHRHPLRGVTDRWLVSQFLPAGCRSALFGLQSISRATYEGTLALHFFYLNVGDAKHPYLARVEIPRWVAENETQVNLLHAALLEQCRIMGSRPYPYILHRAHEIAVVKIEEQKQIEQMLAIELRRAGSEVEDKSYKQLAKDSARL